MMPDGRQGYVLGFMFSEDRRYVALIEKNRPTWQAGLLNGVGGHIEDDDDGPGTAMAREFREETGVQTDPGDWEWYASLSNEKCFIYIFRMFSDKVWDARTLTDEEVFVRTIGNNFDKRIPNLSWLIPLALDKSTGLVRANF